jgi:hypothetical protein
VSSDPENANPPKTSESDPPAANRPVEEGSGSPPPRLPEPADAAGRKANDPSVKEQGLVPEAMQVSRGKPDGEVDTGNRNRPAADLFAERG